MVISADTSFLFSLYGNDANSLAAVAHMQQCSQAITISRMNRFELRNALRFAEFRQAIKPGEAQFLAAIKQGRLQLRHCDISRLENEAERLSAKHTLSGGHRGFDIIQVAAARLFQATEFLTFDTNQKKLAAAEGMYTPF